MEHSWIKRKSTVFLILATYLISIVNPVSAVAAILKKGTSGVDVRELQDDLKALGYFQVNSTGYYGSITQSSVLRFQKVNNLKVDGIVGPQTLACVDAKLAAIEQSSQDKENQEEDGQEDVLGDEQGNEQGNGNNPDVLMKGIRSGKVTALQKDLKLIGFFTGEVTGYFGNETENAVLEFQKGNGVKPDGIAGPETLREITNLIKRAGGSPSRSESNRDVNYLYNWFDGAEDIFERGTVATVTDVDTGLSFKVKRTYGTNHADCEPLTANDTAKMKKAYGGTWSWVRRAIIVDVDGTKMAASMNGMPHAGLEKYAAGKYVSGRAGGFGYGYNYDSVKNNDFNGHFCIHFVKSRTHGSNKVDTKHQEAVQKAAKWAKLNY
ncbi:MAG: peptidoglycan-binding protein [Eubacteriales bacterium]|nr:peptidoglycan-binding protein [Eubacteriales bacterium]